MKNKKAFTITLEFILIMLMCTAVVGVCLAIFTDNFGGLFDNSRNYKTIFERRAD